METISWVDLALSGCDSYCILSSLSPFHGFALFSLENRHNYRQWHNDPLCPHHLASTVISSWPILFPDYLFSSCMILKQIPDTILSINVFIQTTVSLLYLKMNSNSLISSNIQCSDIKLSLKIYSFLNLGSRSGPTYCSWLMCLLNLNLPPCQSVIACGQEHITFQSW